MKEENCKDACRVCEMSLNCSNIKPRKKFIYNKLLLTDWYWTFKKMYLDLISRIYYAHESQLARNVCLRKVKTLYKLFEFLSEHLGSSGAHYV